MIRFVMLLQHGLRESHLLEMAAPLPYRQNLTEPGSDPGDGSERLAVDRHDAAARRGFF